MTASSLPRSAPVDQGVDAAAVMAYLDAADAAGIDQHSFMMVKSGHVVAEGWWAPYAAERPHLLYSLSKSFTSTAIGIAVDEGLLSLDDTLISFFPDKVPAEVDERLAALKVRHLLAMASGHEKETAGAIMDGGPDVVRTFLGIPLDADPGTLFCYNQGCTMSLSEIITERTGEKLVDYLQSRLFGPIGVAKPHWLELPDGRNQGFSGLHATTETIATLGQIYLDGGTYQGRRIVSEAYVAEAQRAHVDNSASSENPDWQQGYGFQFWRCRHHAYRGDGAFGQFLVILPDHDALIVVTALSRDMQQQADLFWQHLLPALAPARTPDGGADEALASRLAAVQVRGVDATGAGPREPVTFAFTGEAPNRLDDLGELRVEPAEGEDTRLVLRRGDSEAVLDVHPGAWTPGHLENVGQFLPEVEVSGGWSGDAYAADVIFVTTPHRLRLRGRRDGVTPPRYQAEWVIPPL